MHHLPEDLDVLFQEWLNRNVDQQKLNTWTGRSLLKLAFQAGFELRDVAEGRKRAAMNDLERHQPDYPGGSDDYAPPRYRNPSQPPFFTATRDAYVPDTDGMRAYDTRFFPIPGHDRPIPGHEAAVAPETRNPPGVNAEIPAPPGPREQIETAFDYIESVWAENDKA